MILHLLKKDCLIVKKYLLFVGILSFLIPIFFHWQSPDRNTFPVFLITVIFIEFMLQQSISIQEMTYEKAACLLTVSPYGRKLQVAARYLFFALVFIWTVAAFFIVSLFLPEISFLKPQDILFSFSILTLLYCSLLPVQYKLGYEKTRYIFMIVIIISPYLLGLVFKNNQMIDFTFINQIPEIFRYLVPTFLLLILITVSVKASMHFYQEKEL